MATFRQNGAIGALLDEYERAVKDLQTVISPLTPEELTKIVDKQTNDPDCVSIQTILSHVVCSGYGYIVYIRKHCGEELNFFERERLDSVALYHTALTEMFRYNEQFFEDYPNVSIEELNNDKKIKTRWGQLFDIEQLLEHAIVHILRHRRQIEKFKTLLTTTKF